MEHIVQQTQLHQRFDLEELSEMETLIITTQKSHVSDEMQEHIQQLKSLDFDYPVQQDMFVLEIQLQRHLLPVQLIMVMNDQLDITDQQVLRKRFHVLLGPIQILNELVLFLNEDLALKIHLTT